MLVPGEAGWAVFTQGQQHQGEDPLPIKTWGRFLFQKLNGRCFNLFSLSAAAIQNAVWKSVFLCRQLFSFTSLTMTKAWSWVTGPAASGWWLTMGHGHKGPKLGLDRGVGVGKPSPLRKCGSPNRLTQFPCPSSKPWLATGLAHQHRALYTHPLSARHSLSLCADHWKSL